MKKTKNAKKPMAKNAKDLDQDKRIARINKRLTKFADTTREVGLVETRILTVTPLYSIPLLYLLNGMAKGPGLSERTGDTAYMKYIEMKFQLRCNNSAFFENQAIRVMLVREKTALSATISLTSFMDTNTPYTFDLPNKKDVDPNRYKIYYDKTFDMSGQSPFTKNMIIRRKLGFKTNYSRGDTGLVTDIDTNSLFLILISDNNDTLQTPIFSADIYVHYNK